MVSSKKVISLIYALVLNFTVCQLPTYADQAVPDINGRAYVLYDATCDVTITGENQSGKLAPASITKVMTILLALENLDMSDEITITKDMYWTIPNDYMRLGLVEGEVITVKDAIYASMLISANDASMALALTISDSVEDFAGLMNQRAVQLGCKNTNFTNPYGYADPEHLTTAEDMARIMAKAIEYDEFCEAAITSYYSVPVTNMWDTPRGMKNHNSFVDSSAYKYDPYIAGKTGYTDMSRFTIVSAAEKDGRTLIAVILGSDVSHTRFTDSIALFEYGFSGYRRFELSEDHYSQIKGSLMDALTFTSDPEDKSIEISGTDMELKRNILIPASIKEEEITFSADDISNLSGTAVYDLYLGYGDVREKVGTMEIKYTVPEQSAPEDMQGSALGTFIKLLLYILIPILLILIFLWYLRISSRKRRKRRYR